MSTKVSLSLPSLSLSLLKSCLFVLFVFLTCYHLQKRVPQIFFCFVYHTRFCLMASSWNIDLGSRMKSFVCPSSYFSCSFHLNFLAFKLIKTNNNKLFLPKSPLQFGNFFFLYSLFSLLSSLSLARFSFYRR